MAHRYDIPALDEIRRAVDRLETLLDQVDGRHSCPMLVRRRRLPAVAHWYLPVDGMPRVFRSPTIRDGAEEKVQAIERNFAWLHDGKRFWSMGERSETNDNEPDRKPSPTGPKNSDAG